MKTTMRILLALSLAQAIGCRGAAPETMAASSLAVAVDDPAGLAERGPAPRVQLGVTRQLIARLSTPSLPEPVAWVTLQLFTPTGALYQQRHVPFAAGPNPPRTATHEGISDPVDVQPARAVPGGWALDLWVPVAGTNFERRPQTGTWRIRAALDGRPDVAVETAVEIAQDPQGSR